MESAIHILAGVCTCTPSNYSSTPSGNYDDEDEDMAAIVYIYVPTLVPRTMYAYDDYDYVQHSARPCRRRWRVFIRDGPKEGQEIVF